MGRAAEGRKAHSRSLWNRETAVAALPTQWSQAQSSEDGVGCAAARLGLSVMDLQFFLFLSDVLEDFTELGVVLISLGILLAESVPNLCLTWVKVHVHA